MPRFVKLATSKSVSSHSLLGMGTEKYSNRKIIHSISSSLRISKNSRRANNWNGYNDENMLGVKDFPMFVNGDKCGNKTVFRVKIQEFFFILIIIRSFTIRINLVQLLRFESVQRMNSTRCGILFALTFQQIFFISSVGSNLCRSSSVIAAPWLQIVC